MNKILKHIKDGYKLNMDYRNNNVIKPKLIDFTVTERCNSRCTHCNIWKNPLQNNDMTPEQIDKAFSDEFMDEVEYIMLSGGEPTCRNDIFQIIDILHKHCPKATLQLSTNGILSGRVLSITKYALERGIKFDVGISLDGFGRNHDIIRGVPGNFEAVDYLLDQLAELKNKKDYKDLLDYCVGITVSDMIVDGFDSLKSYVDNMGVHMEYAWYQETDFYNNKSGTGIGMARTKHIVEAMPDQPRKAAWLYLIKNGKIKPFTCFGLRTFFVLKNNGDVVPCFTHWNKSIGNITKESFRTIFERQYSDKDSVMNTTVKDCQGCLNTWAWTLSNIAALKPYILYYIQKPQQLYGSLKKK